jgi:hypothetical protein
MDNDIFMLMVALVLGLILIAWFRVQIQYFFRRSSSKHWPTVDATLQRGCLGAIEVNEAPIPTVFVGYAYILGGIRYAGYFAISGENQRIEKLNRVLAGGSIQIRYDPSSPARSFLADESDSRFDGLKASQNPERLNQAPPFDLQDALR